MRIIYLIMFFTLRYSTWIIYPRFRRVNGPKSFYGRTIFVSNHPASFMDPLVIAAKQRSILFFMTRYDVFTKFTKPFLWACQMLPIYRQLDGGDTRSKNDLVFEKTSKILSRGRNLLIFGEGFTDDVFIRRLKPVKKGAVKIGFTALEKLNWKKKVYIAAIGCNYSDPNQMRSDLLIANSEPICLNDYREAYETNPIKVVSELTALIQKLMQEQITHIEKTGNSELHENIMILTRKGMNAISFDPAISLYERWKYSQNLATWLNKQDINTDEKLQTIQEELENYIKLLKQMKLNDALVYWKKTNGTRSKEWAALLLLFPLMIVGLIHCFIPYYFVKNFTEKTFKRRVFWSSVKMILAKFSIGIFNLPFIFVFYHFIYPSWWLAIAYFTSIGLTGTVAYIWFNNFKSLKAKNAVNKVDLSALIAKRDHLNTKLLDILPQELA